MSNLMDANDNNYLMPYSSNTGSLASDILNAIPLALAAPILAYQTTKARKELLSILSEAKRQERSEILKTMQVLASHGQLTSELSQQLMVLPILRERVLPAKRLLFEENLRKAMASHPDRRKRQKAPGRSQTHRTQ